MTLLVRAARILDPASPYHHQTLDLLIRDGKIAQLGSGLEAPDAEVLEGEGLCVSPGWFDSFAHFCDPGQEHREDLVSGAAAAAAGGFTAVAITPNTDPPLHDKAGIEYVRARTAVLPVRVYPCGALSRDLKGAQIAELCDMREAGAIAFGEGSRPMRNAALMLHALRYVQPFNGLVINLPLDADMAGSAGVHEGLAALNMGLPGIPGMAEALMVQRDLQLLEYTGGRLHIPLISSHRSVDLIREAKAKGLEVTAGVAAYQLLFDEDSVAGFDTRYKVMPPLRARRDREALIQGLLDGTIDLVCSHHMPRHEDEKRVEFEYAAFGINGLETTFSALNMALYEQVSMEHIVQWLCIAPRTLFDLKVPLIREGEEAELTFFRPQAFWAPEAPDLRSRSRNNPFIGSALRGVVDGIFCRGQFVPRRHEALV